MERLTRRNENGSIDVKLDGIMQRTYNNHIWYNIFEKLAYYEDLEERISSIFEDITIEMIVGEIEVEYNKSIENILNLCKKLKEMV